KDAIRRPRVVPAWSHNSPLMARSMSVLAMLVGAGKNAARSIPARARTSQAASAASMVERGIIISRQRMRESILLYRGKIRNLNRVCLEFWDFGHLNLFRIS